MSTFNVDTPDNNSSKPQDDSARRNDQAVKQASKQNRGLAQGLANGAGRRFSTGNSTAAMDQLQEGIRKAMENDDQLKAFITVVPVPTSMNIRYPAIALAHEFKDEAGQKAIAYFYYPLEDRVGSLEKVDEDDRRDRRDSVIPVPTDVIDRDYQDAVEKALSKYFLGSQAFYCAGQQIIGQLFEMEYKENTLGYRQLIMAAAGQIDTRRDIALGGTGNTISPDQMLENYAVVAMVDFKPSISEDLSGNPIRSDINISLREQRVRGRNSRRDRNNDDNESSSVYNGGGASTDAFATIDVMLNFVYVDDEDRDFGDDDDRGRDRHPRAFVPEARITNLNIRTAPTIGNYLYAITAVGAITKSQRWVESCLPKMIRQTPSRNLGALYYEQPRRNEEPKVLDLSGDEDKAVYDFANYATTKDMMLTLMCPETSEYSNISDHFHRMASCRLGSPEYMDLYDLLMDDIKIMLGGKSMRWNSEDPIVAEDQSHRCLLGYYPTEDGKTAPSDDIDYRSLMNNADGRGGIEQAEDWDASYTKDSYQEGTKIRADIQYEETDGLVKFYSAATTVTFYMDFINALQDDLDNVGLAIKSDTTQENSNRRTRRARDSVSGFAGRSKGFRDYRRGNDDRGRGRDRDRGRSRRR